MDALPTPVLDDHLHLHPEGDGPAAAEAFARAGGTHLLVLNRPSWHHVEAVEDVAAVRTAFESTLELVASADEAVPGRAWAVLGVHPVLLVRLVEDAGWSLDAAVSLMREGLELAASFVEDGRAIAIKSGRPHFPVDAAIREASNGLIRHAIELAASVDCAVQLHTEDTDDLSAVAADARAAGLEPHRVVKHFAGGPVEGVTPSVIARRDPIDAITATDAPFMLETDFMDDPERPGAVLGPKVVPRRSRTLAEAGDHRALEVAHVETPAAVYGIDTRGTLG